MGVNEYFKYLSVGLPADIERCKQHGDFARAIRLIDNRLAGNVPEPLKKCLTVEREIMLRLADNYPYTREQALAIIRADVPDFSDAEFTEYVDGRKIDWIYVGGEERYFDRFYQTLLKVNADFARRAAAHRKSDADDDVAAKERALLAGTIEEMKQNGRASYRFRIRASLKVNDDKFVPGKKLRVYLPVPAACRQTSGVVLHDMTDLPHRLAPASAAQRTICFTAVPQQNTEFFVDYSFTNTVYYTDAYHAAGHPGVYDFDVHEQQPHIVFSPCIQELARSLCAHTDDPMEKARCFYDFITKNVKYSFMRDYFCLTGIAEHCARSLTGDCGVQALLFITLCRAAGIPARWQSALFASPLSVGAHDWAEFYVEPYGWLFADPSFGGGSERQGNEAQRQFYFGNLDPFRMVANREFYAPFVPDMAFFRGDPYDNQTGEAEYEDGPLCHDDCARSQVMLDWKKII